MKVEKRNGTIEAFDRAKLETSIGNASDDIAQPLTEGDLHRIVNTLVDKVTATGKDSISFRSIHYFVIETLRENSFNDIAAAYDRSSMSTVRK